MKDLDVNAEIYASQMVLAKRMVESFMQSYADLAQEQSTAQKI